MLSPGCHCVDVTASWKQQRNMCTETIRQKIQEMLFFKEEKLTDSVKGDVLQKLQK